MSSQSMLELQQYPWPGNVRELQNVIERAAVLTSSEVLRVPALLPLQHPADEPVTLEEPERSHIARILFESNGVVGAPKGAAARLGIARTTLIYKMRKRGLASSDIPVVGDLSLPTRKMRLGRFMPKIPKSVDGRRAWQNGASNLRIAYLIFVLVICAGTSLFAAGSPDDSEQGIVGELAASSYCRTTGGKVVFRQAAYGTNADNPKAWLWLANTHAFCEYTSSQDGSTVGIFLDTLVTDKPTLAALAYYAQVQPATPPDGGNPAAYYCSQLGGSDHFGSKEDGSGGGWVNLSAGEPVREACIFPDLSTIDSFGLFYHSAGLINGI